MSLLSKFIRDGNEGTVDTAEVVEVREGRVRLRTPQGELWARAGGSLRVGNSVTFARIGSDLQVLNVAKSTRKTAKIWRI